MLKKVELFQVNLRRALWHLASIISAANESFQTQYIHEQREACLPVMKRGILLSSEQQSQKPFIFNKGTTWLKT